MTVSGDALERYRIDDLHIDVGTREVRRGTEPVALPPLSFELLLTLVRRAPNVVTADELMGEVWAGRVVNDETVAKRVELVRQALGDDSRRPRYLGLVRGQGYRLLPPVTRLDAADDASVPSTSTGRRWIRQTVIAGAAALAAVFVLWAGVRLTRPAPPADVPAAAPRSLVVLPLDNLSGEPEQAYFVAGMHDALITDLSKAGGLNVISRTSALAYQSTDKSVPQIASELGVDLIMEGSVYRAGNRVRITVQLIGADDRHLWAESYAQDLSDVLRLQSRVARSVADAVEVTLTPQEVDRLAASRTVDPQTYEIFLRGVFEIDRQTPESLESGLELLRRATETDPQDPLPYARLALAYNRIGHAPGAATSAFPRATAAALQALGLDDGLAEAHVALAESRLYFHWDWPGAARSFDRALAINPSLAPAYGHRAWLEALYGRHDQALADMRRAVALDPREPLWQSWYGWLHLWHRNYEAAARAQLAALEINPDFPVANFVLGQTYSLQGRHEQALAAFARAASASPHWSWGLGQGYALAGREAEARAVARDLEARAQPDPWALAEIYTALGEHDTALTWLETGYEIRRDWMPWVQQNVFFTPLLDEPRFLEIVRRLDLPPGSPSAPSAASSK